jgi:tRNA/tmRNA/rRNA uracil-C5-methylase (TrmA/RlmC/RlmD family)
VLSDAVVQAIDWSLWDPEAANGDLYGGVGLFAVAIATRGGSNTRIMSVESHAVASVWAGHNLTPWSRAHALTSEVLAFVRGEVAGLDAESIGRYRAATIVLDPPRSGAAGEVVGALIALAPRQIVYVACDPVAFARDQKMLAEGGYDLAGLEAFDLFPHTHHVEMVASFRRSS